MVKTKIINKLQNDDESMTRHAPVKINPMHPPRG